MKIGLSKIVFLGLVFFTTPNLAQDSSGYGTALDDDMRLYCNRETAYSTGVSDARKGLARKKDFASICSVNREYFDAAYQQGYSFGLTNQSGLIVNEPAPYHPDIQNQLPASTVQPYTRPPETTPGYATPPGRNTIPDANTAASDNKFSGTSSYPGQQQVNSGDFARPYPTQGLKTLVEVVPSAIPKCIQTANGQACGFNCVNSLNNVRCAMNPSQVCRSNENGDIACGYHCISTSKTVRCAAFLADTCVSDTNGYVFCGQNCRIEGNATGVCDIERYAP